MPRSDSATQHKFASFVFSLVCYLAASFLLGSCSNPPSRNPNTLTLLIESNPANLDPRFATDAQSQHLDGLIFDSLVERDDQMVLHGDLAESWDTPDALTYVFHLKHGIVFHDGSPFTSVDVKSTFDYIRDIANHSPKRGNFFSVASVEAPDANTVVVYLKEPDASFLWNLCRGAIGIVPAGAGAGFAQHPVGTGPFRFVSQAQDDDVVLAGNANYFRGAPALESVHVRVVPDAIVRALELRKGSADVEISSLSPDMIPVLAKQPDLAISHRSGTNVNYLGFNLDDPLLARREVRQALAYATDREAIIRYLLHGQARIADGVMPPTHWAYEANVSRYAGDSGRAAKLLDAAGFPPHKDGVRLHLVLKTSTEERYRLIAAALQQQWRQAGIALEIRPLEFATLLSDAIKGNFQINLLSWVGANNDPDFFNYLYSSTRIPPNGGNRARYRNSEVDELTAKIKIEMDQEERKELCSQVQKIAANDLPIFPLWFADAVSVHRRELGDLNLSPTGDFDFLATLSPRKVVAATRSTPWSGN
ncbi:MAG TPA: ABC transporter substrate-binding protein [Candidatus Acidoferrum sp.]|nr:ABC transporter substrate-binding protein [Candidatus Acidoferrum sp.]